jgi:hypothetical protein
MTGRCREACVGQEPGTVERMETARHVSVSDVMQGRRSDQVQPHPGFEPARSFSGLTAYRQGVSVPIFVNTDSRSACNDGASMSDTVDPYRSAKVARNYI